MISGDCGLLADHKKEPYTDKEMDVLLEAGGGNAATCIPECRYLDKHADGAGLADLKHLAGTVKKLMKQKKELLDFLHVESRIFKDSKTIKQEDLVMGDVSDLYMHGECGVRTLLAVKDMDSKGLRCENLLELVKQMKKWRAAQEKVISDRKMLMDFINRPACKFFDKRAQPKILAKDVDAIIICCDENVMHAVKECGYQESVGLRVETLDELRTMIMRTRHQRATLKEFLVSSNIFLDSPMDHSVSEEDVFKIVTACGGVHSLDAAKAIEAADQRCVDVHELIMKMMMVPKGGGADGGGIQTAGTAPPESKQEDSAVAPAVAPAVASATPAVASATPGPPTVASATPVPAVASAAPGGASEGTEEGPKLEPLMSKPDALDKDVLDQKRVGGGVRSRVPSRVPSPIAEEDEEEEKHDTETGGGETKASTEGDAATAITEILPAAAIEGADLALGVVADLV
jgi:hypothetical protein